MIQDLFWLVAFGIGGLAAWLDWKNRDVPNAVWVLGLFLLAPLLIVESVRAPAHFFLRLGLALGFFVLLFGFWRLNQIGGADVKGFAFFGLALSPVGYYEPIFGKIYPALDILVASLVIGELLRRFMKQKSVPLFTVSQWPLMLAPVAGGLVWWPIVTFVRFTVG